MNPLRVALPPWTRRGIALRHLLGRRIVTDPARIAWDRYAARHRKVVFVQIGSHNGIDGDPLARWIDRHPKWCGTMVEPIPEQFDALTELRGNQARFRLVRAAITDHDGTVEMTVVDRTEDLPDGVTQLSSIHTDVVLGADVPVSDHLRRVVVPAMTFASLMEGSPQIDVLHIDAEGHDAVILDQVDLVSVRPAVVMFERAHLSHADRESCEVRLSEAGYRVVSNSLDTVALLPTKDHQRPD
jgi:FkbM family methyltransferase